MSAAEQTHLSERDYIAVLRPLEAALGQQGDARGALSIVSYLAPLDRATWQRAMDLLPDVPSVDRAPILAAQGRMAEAADEAENAGLVAAAAIYREKAKDWAAARALWSRLAHVTERGDDAYVTALVRFDVARCARQCADASQSREALVASVRLLEEAADHFESIGQRERAFDCFQVLVQIGRESGSAEDVIEGFVNSIRILREDHLKHDFALDLFEEGIAAATGSGETRAAATFACQAAEYARSLGLAEAASHMTVKEAQLWRAVAREQEERGAPPEVAENALLAAALAFCEAGQFSHVRELYVEIGQLDLGGTRREQYARAAKRYEKVDDKPLQRPSAALQASRKEAFTQVWHVDVLEWERQGSAAAVCSDVLVDTRAPDLFRRKALLARLTALQVEGKPDDGSASMLDARLRLAKELGQVQLYSVLSPLENLFDRPERPLKIAVLQALQTLFYKRSFITVRAALRDPDSVIVDHAARAVEALRFPHAVDPLSRIVHESPRPAVRAAALRALAHIDTREAAEIVLGALEHGTPSDRTAAISAVKDARGTRLMELARAALPTATGMLHASLRDLLASAELNA